MINQGQWPSPHSHHQCTLVAEALVIIPVVTAMATPGNCCLPESAPAGQAGHCQAAPGGSSGHPLAAPGASPPARCLCLVSLPAITDSGQLVGRAGTSRLATYTTVHWPLIPSGSGHLPLGPGSGYPGAVSQFHHAAFQLT